MCAKILKLLGNDQRQSAPLCKSSLFHTLWLFTVFSKCHTHPHRHIGSRRSVLYIMRSKGVTAVFIGTDAVWHISPFSSLCQSVHTINKCPAHLCSVFDWHIYNSCLVVSWYYVAGLEMFVYMFASVTVQWMKCAQHLFQLLCFCYCNRAWNEPNVVSVHRSGTEPLVISCMIFSF